MNETNPTPTQQGETLEPCPFCGGEAVLLDDPASEYPADGKVHHVTCLDSCSIAPGVYGQDSKEEAIRKWNSRPPWTTQKDNLCDKHKNEYEVFYVGGCLKCWQENECESSTRRAAVAGPRGDAESLVKKWVATLQDESRVTDEDAEDLMFRIIAFTAATSSPAPAESTRVAGEQDFRKIAEQIVNRSLCAEPSHSCEESAAVHVRDLIESIAALPKSQYDALCEQHKNEFTVFHVGGCLKCWQESEAVSTTRATTSDSARRAAEEIVGLCLRYFGGSSPSTARDYPKTVEEAAAIISKHFAAAPADNDAESLLSKIVTIADIGSAEEFEDALERLKSIRQLIDTTTKQDR